MRLLLAAALTAAVLVPVTSASATPTWAPATTATVHPGVQTVTGGTNGCTANFVFYDSSNNVYIGEAAHCASTSGNTVTNGCQATTMPINTSVTVGPVTGTMVYNSWITMQANNENPSSNVCAYNDLAIIKLNASDYSKVNPSIPFWGGPTSLGTGAASFTEVYSYGNSSLRLGITALSPKYGYTTNNSPSGGWTHNVYTGTPGIPGDSGSAFLNSTGQALGVLSTLSVTGSNNLGNLSQELAYLTSHVTSLSTLQLAVGTEPFAPLLG
jgi:hypothetical protein